MLTSNVRQKTNPLATSDQWLQVIDEKGMAQRYVSLDREAVLQALAMDGMQLKDVYREADNLSAQSLHSQYRLPSTPVPGFKPDIHLAGDFRNDKEMVLTAVLQNGLALDYASPTLKKDIDIVLAAVSQNGDALFKADASFRGNKAVVMKALKTSGLAATVIDDALITERDVARAMVQCHGLSLERVAKHHSGVFLSELVGLAIQKNGRSLKFAGEGQSDRAVVQRAVWQNSSALQYASEDLQTDWQLKGLQAVSALLAFGVQYASVCKAFISAIAVAATTFATFITLGAPVVASACIAAAAGGFSGSYFFSKFSPPQADTQETPTMNCEHAL